MALDLKIIDFTPLDMAPVDHRPVDVISFWKRPTDIPESEADALRAFFTATGGAGWTDKTGWGATATAADWFGVTVSGGHVTAIELPSNNLTGDAGTTLAPLAATLVTLDLGGNSTTITTTSLTALVLPYGMIWNATADTYQIGKVSVLGVFTETAVTAFPIQEQMKRCTLMDNGTVNYYLSPTDSTKKADGVTASDLTGADGQVMVEIPKFYFIQAQSGVYRYFFINSAGFSLTLSDASLKTAAVHPAFYKGGSATPSDYRYVGAYEGSMYDASAGAMTAVNAIHTGIYASGDKMCSVSGQYPKTMETIIECRAMAKARGTGWHQFDHALHAALSILYLTEYADFDSQAKIGNGRTYLSNGDWVASETWDGINYGYIGKCGKSNVNGNATGANNKATNLTIAESPAYMSYRGIENWYGNVWKFLDGANIHNATATGSRLYLCINHTQYASDTATNYTLSGALPLAEGYAKDVINTLGVYPASIGGASSTYIADYYSTYYDNLADSGWKVAMVGGVATHGAMAGAFYVNSSNGSASTHVTFGGRLCY